MFLCDGYVIEGWFSKWKALILADFLCDGYVIKRDFEKKARQILYNLNPPPVFVNHEAHEEHEEKKVSKKNSFCPWTSV